MTATTSGPRIDSRAAALPEGMVRCEDGLVRSNYGHGRVVPEWRVSRSVPVPVPSRTTRAASWLVWHVGEITGVTIPAGIAVAVTPWAWLVSGAVAVGWAVHAARTAVEQASLRAELAARAASMEQGTTGGSDVDASGETTDDPAPDTEPTEPTGSAGAEALGGVA